MILLFDYRYLNGLQYYLNSIVNLTLVRQCTTSTGIVATDTHLYQAFMWITFNHYSSQILHINSCYKNIVIFHVSLHGHLLSLLQHIYLKNIATMYTTSSLISGWNGRLIPHVNFCCLDPKNILLYLPVILQIWTLLPFSYSLFNTVYVTVSSHRLRTHCIFSSRTFLHYWLASLTLTLPVNTAQINHHFPLIITTSHMLGLITSTINTSTWSLFWVLHYAT